MTEDLQLRFPNVHYIVFGGISYVYEVHPRIVVKVPQSGEFEKDQFQKELQIYKILSDSPPCPYIVQAYHLSDSGIFLEYMRDETLSLRIQRNHSNDYKNRIVTSVEKLEPLFLRKQWMNDLTQAVAFLESLNLAHGDLRPENILLDRNQLKLSDFNYTGKIGTYKEICHEPYGRLLNGDEADEGERGTAGFFGPRTEQFALGSLYYFINYGFEVYGDRCISEDPREHGPQLMELLQKMVFPTLTGDPLIDDIIERCWHNKYKTISELATHVEALLNAETSAMGNNETTIEKISEHDQDSLGETFLSKRAICQDLEERGLLRTLASGEPEEIGFKFEMYRHALPG